MPSQAPDNLAAALAPRPGGLTAEDVAKVAARTKHSVRAKQEDLKAAAAKVDQAFVNYFPRVSAGASYTFNSNIPAFNLGGLVTTDAVPSTAKAGSGAFIPAAPNLPAGTTATVPGIGKLVCPKTATNGCYSNMVGVSAAFTFPNSYGAFSASISVPVSDYVLRLAQGYSAASHNEKSARVAADAEALQAAADARIAYFNWVRAKGAIVVTQEAVDQSKAHLDDAKKAFNVGLASRADVLRIDAQVAAAQQSQAEAIAFAAVAEEQVRVLLGVPPDRVLEIGDDVMNEPAVPPAETLQALQEQAMTKRLELRSLDEAVASLKQVESVTKAGYVPRVDAFGDAVYGNPNQRIFPPTQTWTATWDVGVRASWTLNDTFTTIGAAAEAKAHTAAIVEQRGALQDGLRVEVASAYADAIKAPPTIEAAERGMVAAEESLRVRRELFRNGKATSTELLDAEGELTQARLRRLDAHVGQLVARARLDHATGRDVPARPTNE
jgi:outer membrane protein TolC